MVCKYESQWRNSPARLDKTRNKRELELHWQQLNSGNYQLGYQLEFSPVGARGKRCQGDRVKGLPANAKPQSIHLLKDLDELLVLVFVLF